MPDSYICDICGREFDECESEFKDHVYTNYSTKKRHYTGRIRVIISYKIFGPKTHMCAHCLRELAVRKPWGGE